MQNKIIEWRVEIMNNTNSPLVSNEKVKKLADILKRLNSGENPEETKKETLELVKNINPLELSMAEQQLIDDGYNPQDLRSLCSIHMEVLKDELAKVKSSIEIGHPLYTLIDEHEQILDFLTQLDEVNFELQKKDKYDGADDAFERLKKLAELILGAEKHHLREENVLFPRLEQRGVTGPTRIMRMEHDDLRARKHKLEELAGKASEMDYKSFKEELADVSGYIVFNLRDHIFKENHILYPSALNVLQEKGIWDEMKDECDKIGYCSFTPKY
jgi:DUF438 domain-containing protein